MFIMILGIFVKAPFVRPVLNKQTRLFFLVTKIEKDINVCIYMYSYEEMTFALIDFTLK